ncbi:Endopolygalacturonase B [Sphaceloma murrayae]|uniref:endo-polygalacturonase n=1 Tax=Sphaceloma murrayae TaxID=2082308 RepID=A0A2K1QSP6_9PEZI|nr:Endopolygalacturonase B [Sphaceloma murrayae]
MQYSLILSALAAGAVYAAPSSSKRASCTFTDAATAVAQKKSCTNIVLNGIKVPAGTTLDLTGLTTGTTVTFQGTTTFGYKEWEGPLVSFSGTKITISGASGHMINFGGEQYWDGKGGNGGKTKPKSFSAHKLIDSTIQNINVKNTPTQFMSINGAQNLNVKNVVMDNSLGDTKGGHNTDAFDVGSSTGVHISGANVKNQDDCLAVNSGTDISFTDGTCSGGHGLSIGSVGGRDNNDVKNVYIANSKIINSQNGVRVKTVYDATGSVNNVTYSGITLSNITKYGIVIEQDYENGSPTGTPTTGVPITKLTVSGVTGSVASSATPIYLLCGKGSCSGWTWKNVAVTGGKKSTKCLNVPAGAAC